MTSLILMYLYYDNNGDIKAITPNMDLSFSEFSVTTFPLSDVEPFLTGKRNPFDFMITCTKKATGNKYNIVKKECNINVTRTIDNFLTKIDTNNSESIITIVTYIKNNIITLNINNLFKDLLKIGTEDEKDDITSFINRGISGLYFTKKNNPYHLLHSIIFNTKKLFDEEILSFEYDKTIDLSNSSVYTKKIIDSYYYKIKA